MSSFQTSCRIVVNTLLLPFSLLFFCVSAYAADNLSPLPKSVQEEISKVCLPVQYREGAAAYRSCLENEVELRSQQPDSAMARLAFDDKYAVQQACSGTGNQRSDAYRQCINQQIQELQQYPQPILARLSDDELYVLQQACFHAQSKLGAAAYRICINQQLVNLDEVPRADLSGLSALNKNALQLRCSEKSKDTTNYRRCIASEFKSIVGKDVSFLDTKPNANNTLTSNNVAAVQPQPKVETSVAKVETPPQEVIEQPEPTVETNTDTEIQTANANDDSPVINKANQAVADTNIEAPEPVSTEPDTLVAADIATDSTAVALASTNNSSLKVISTANAQTNTTDPQPSDNEISTATRVISRPELVETLAEQERLAAQSQAENGATPLDKAPEVISHAFDTVKVKAQALFDSAVEQAFKLDSKGWLIVAAALALPALILIIWSAVRSMGRKRQDTKQFEEHTATAPPPPLEDEASWPQQAVNKPHSQAAVAAYASPTDSDTQRRFNTDATRFAPKPAPTPTPAPAEINPVAHKQHPSIQWQSSFGPWLSQQPSPVQLQLSIEFLVYWSAYGDERYEPELKRRLFTSNELNTHDQIKRWVLKQDMFAFADAINWMRFNASQAQKEQIVALLMALLMTENSVTPVQNTLLRFLSDAFNLGIEQVQSQFLRAFGHELPPVPRTDKVDWWIRQDALSVSRWNARALLEQSPREQFMARLGLAEHFDEASVVSAFKRAARRCHPSNFSALSERECAMAAQSFKKFEQARDSLLGVSI